MLVSNKHFTPVIGLDIHIVILLGFPVPLPHPYIGFVMDPMDYIPFIGATTKINHVPRGKSDTSGIIIILFHIPMGGPFLLAPMIGHDSVNFFGSKRVKVEGNMMSPSGHMLMTCNDIGIPLSLQPGKKLKPIPSMYLPTSFSIPLSFGRPVMVGGPYVPDWAGALLNLVMSFGFGAMMKGLGKVLKKAGKGLKKVGDKTRQKLTKLNMHLKNELGETNKLSALLCKLGFEPVDLVQGIVVYECTDFELPGPIPIKWQRAWYSDSPHKGPLGHGVHGSYDMRVVPSLDGDATGVLLSDGRSTLFEALPYPGNSDYNRAEQLTLTRTDLDEYQLFNHRERLSYHFHKLHPQDEQYRLYAIRNEAGFMNSFHYNGKGHLVQIIDSAGRHLQVTNDAAGRIVTITAQHRGFTRQLVRYSYNETGDLTGITDALHQTTSIQYQHHLMTAKTDRNGQTFYWEYDDDTTGARCIHAWGDDGLLEGRIEYHPEEGYNLVTNSQGKTTTYYYTPDFLVTQIKDPLGFSKFFEYTEDAQLYREIDEEANVTGYTYDERGNRIAIIQPDGSAYTMAYDDDNRLRIVTDPAGNSRTYIYYKGAVHTGLLHTVTMADGRMTILRYNAQHLLSKLEDEKERQTLFEYDGDHNLTAITQPDGGRTSWEYDAWGQCIRATNPLGHRQHFRYDALNRVTDIQLSDGNHVRLSYDAYDEILEMTDKQRHIRFTYTPLGSMKTREEGGAKIHFIYNKEEQLTAVVNEHGEMYRLTRNDRGDVIQETGFDGLVRRYDRDAAGKVIRLHRPANRWTEFEYDYNGRLTRAEYSDGSWQTYSYNRAGQIIEAMNEHATVRLQRDVLGRVTEEWQNGYTITSNWGANGLRSKLQTNLGAEILLQYNEASDITGIRAHAPGIPDPWQAHIAYNLLGLETTRSLPGGVQSSWTYDQSDMPATQTVNNPQRNTRRRSYRWDANQRLKQVMNGITGGAAKFGHDELGKLAWAQYEDGQFDYRLPDKTGNLYRTQQRVDRKYGPGGKLLETPDARFIYDIEGNLVKKVTSGAAIWEYEWYDNGMLKKVLRPDGKEISFRYDPLGRRIEKQFHDRISRFVWDGNVPLHEWSYPAKERPITTVNELGDVQLNHPEPVPQETLITWVFEEGGFAPVAKLVNGRSYAIITDHLGTPCEAYDTTGEKVWECELDIYGKVRKLAGSAALVPFRYEGQYDDEETGLYYNNFRYYDPATGRYISQDRIRLRSNVWNFYAYTSDVLIWTDPLGLDWNYALVDDNDNVYYHGRASDNDTLAGVRNRHAGTSGVDGQRFDPTGKNGGANGRPDRIVQTSPKGTPYETARGIEQTGIEENNNLLGRNSDQARGNKINGVNPDNKEKYDRRMKAATEYMEENNIDSLNDQAKKLAKACNK